MPGVDDLPLQQRNWK